ncbi:MAG: hypothetical protein JRN29_02340 [Nitrososphaerota archaeon]|nr:hypothetical protein [Nitrososphaerota archaeon]
MVSAKVLAGVGKGAGSLVVLMTLPAFLERTLLSGLRLSPPFLSYLPAFGVLFAALFVTDALLQERGRAPAGSLLWGAGMAVFVFVTLGGGRLLISFPTALGVSIGVEASYVPIFLLIAAVPALQMLIGLAGLLAKPGQAELPQAEQRQAEPQHDL